MRLPPTGFTTTQYINAIRTGKPRHARIYFPNQNKTFREQHIDTNGGIVLSTIGNQYDSFRLGNVIESEVTIRFIMSSDFDGLDWTDEFKLYFGVEISGSNVEICMGYFTGKRPKIDPIHGIIEFTAYDRMHKLNATADDILESLPDQTNMRTIVSAIEAYTGITCLLSGNIWSIPTAWDFNFNSSIFTYGITIKELVGYIAEASGSLVYIDNLGRLLVKQVYNSSALVHDLHETDCFDINVDGLDIIPQKDYGVIVSSSDGVVYSYPSSGSNAYTSLDNPILINAPDYYKETMLTEMVFQYNSVALYVPYSVTMVGNWMYEVGDYVLFHVIHNQLIPSMKSTLQNISFTWNGGCEATIEFPGAEDDTDWDQKAKEATKLGGELAEKYDASKGDALEIAVNALNNKNIPQFKEISITGESNQTVTTSLTVSSASRIRIDFITASASRRGISLVYCNNSGGLTITNISLGSNITVAPNDDNILDVTVTGGESKAYCTIYAGDIS